MTNFKLTIQYDGTRFSGWWGQFGACKKDSAGNIVADETRRDRKSTRLNSSHRT